MFSRTLRSPLLSILLIATGFLFARPVIARDLGSFDGTWEGKLEVVDGTSSKDKDSDSYERTKAAYGKSPFKLTIHGQRATVYFGETEVKPNLFQAQVYMTNAVVLASDSGEDNDGQWVETWDFAVTQKDPETLIVVLSRVVNNVSAPEQPQSSKFFVVAAGEFRRTSQ
jgi:hypothetical protein